MVDYETDRALADLDTLALRERVRELERLLERATSEYVEHQAWRCAHPDRYPLDEVDPPDCPCGLHQFEVEVRAALADHREGEDD